MFTELDAQTLIRYNFVCIRFYGMWRSLASALALGARGRGFKSLHPDQAPWSSGLRHRPFTAVTRVRIPVGSPKDSVSAAGVACTLIVTIVAGASPSGKAPVFGTGIRWFESSRPSHFKIFIFGPLAQLVEQATLNRQVWGSSP